MIKPLYLKTLFAAGFMALSSTAFAQTFYRSYNVNSTTSGGVERLTKTSDGGYIWISGTHNDRLIVKTNAAGTVQWSKVMDNCLALNNIIESSKGGYYVYYSANSKFAYARLSATGNIIWAKNYLQTSAGNINSFAFCPTYDGGFLMGGGNCGLVNYIAKCDTNGNVVWGKQYKNSYSPGTHTVWSILQSTPGKYICSGDDPATSSDGFTSFEIDDNGALSWYKKYQPTGTTSNTMMRMIKHRNGYLIATTWGQDMNMPSLYLTKIDPAGNVAWSKTYSRPSKLQMGDIATNSMGDIVAIGSEVASTDPRFFAFMTDSSGTTQWAQHNQNILYNGNFGDNYYSAAQGAGGTGFFIGGGTSGERLTGTMLKRDGTGMCNTTSTTVTTATSTSVITQPTITPVSFTLTGTAFTQTVSAATLKDSMFCKSGNIETAVASTPALQQILNIYPNPADASLHIDAAGWVRAVLTDLSGRIVLEAASDKGNISTAALPNGVYFLRIMDIDGMNTGLQRIVIRH